MQIDTYCHNVVDFGLRVSQSTRMNLNESYSCVLVDQWAPDVTSMRG